MDHNLRNYKAFKQIVKQCKLEVKGELVELIVKVSRRFKLVYHEGVQIGEVRGSSNRYGYRAVGAPDVSNHKSIGSAAAEAYYLYLIDTKLGSSNV